MSSKNLSKAQLKFSELSLKNNVRVKLISIISLFFVQVLEMLICHMSFLRLQLLMKKKVVERSQFCRKILFLCFNCKWKTKKAFEMKTFAGQVVGLRWQCIRGHNDRQLTNFNFINRFQNFTWFIFHYHFGIILFCCSFLFVYKNIVVCEESFLICYLFFSFSVPLRMNWRNWSK